MRNRYIPYVLLVALTWAVLGQVIFFGSINYDDPEYVFRNPRVLSGLTWDNVRWAFSTTFFRNWHPLTWISYFLDTEWGFGRAEAYHFTNLVLHTLNACLLYLVLNRATSSVMTSAFAAALFAVHPLHVESVAWIAERKDVLSTAFGFLSLWSYVRYAESGSRRWYATALAFFAASLMSKQTLVTLPFVLLLLDYWPLNRLAPIGVALKPVSRRSLGKRPGASASNSSPKLELPWSTLLLEKLPFFLLSAIFSVIAYVVQASQQSVRSLDVYPLSVRLTNAVVVYVEYLRKTFWPTGLAIFYPHPGAELSSSRVVISLILLSAISTVAIWQVRRRPFLIVGWLWYLGTLVPLIGIVQIGDQQMADRYTYFPLVGLFIAASWLIESLIPSRSWKPTAKFVVMAALTVAAAVVGFVQASYWKDGVKLYTHTLAVTRDNRVAHTNLGTTLLEQLEFADAERHFREAIRIRPDLQFNWFNLGVALQGQGRFEEAVTALEQALKLDPDLQAAHAQLAPILDHLGQQERAREHFFRARELQRDPEDDLPSLLPGG